MEEILRIQMDGTLDFFEGEMNARRDSGAIDLLDEPKANIGLIRILLSVLATGDTLDTVKM